MTSLPQLSSFIKGEEASGGPVDCSCREGEWTTEWLMCSFGQVVLACPQSYYVLSAASVSVSSRD